MTITARRIPATPVNTGSGTWAIIRDLIAADNDTARTAIEAVSSVASMLIVEEHTRSDPIIVSGVGPQVRLYTLHGDDAIDADDEPILPLAHDPTDGDWHLSLPASGADLELARTMLPAGRVTVRDVTATEGAAIASSGRQPAVTGITIDLSRLEG